MIVHSYVERKVRDPESFENRTILIPVILCPPSKESETQYTKRILPYFLNPYCVIRQDLTLQAYSQIKDQKPGINILEEASQKLGCIDLRTTRKHFYRIQDKLKEAQQLISEFLSNNFFNLPELTPGSELISSTKTIIKTLSDCLTRIYGKVIPGKYFKLLSVISYLDCYDNFSTTYAFKIASYQDTS